MKTKKLKPRGIILATLLILWVGIFTTDYIRCSSLKTPIFVKGAGEISQDGGTGEYKGLGYTVKVRKHKDAEYGEVVESVEMWVGDRVVSASIQ